MNRKRPKRNQNKSPEGVVDTPATPEVPVPPPILDQVEKWRAERETLVSKLQAEKDTLLERVGQINDLLRELGVTTGSTIPSGARGRNLTQNTITLREALTEALRANGGPMRVKDLAQAVLERGYTTTSKSFDTQVSQTLNTGDGSFVKVDRGVYTLP